MRPTNASKSIFGKWSMGIALLANASQPLPAVRRQVLEVRLRDCIEDIRAAPAPAHASWNDLVDCMNLLVACETLGWIEDAGGTIPAGRDALLESHQNLAQHGKLRASARGLEGLSNMVTDAVDLLEQLTERQYWSAIRAVEKHVLEVSRGQRHRQHDTIISL